MGSMSLTEKILEVLKQLAQEDVYEMLSFDVKDGKEPGGKTYQELYMGRAKREMKSLDWASYEDWKNMTPWQKLCIYKVSDDAGVDCDVALRNVVLYALAYGLLEEGWKIEEQRKGTGQYQLRSRAQPAWVLRGDTMNSYSTTTCEYLDKKFNLNLTDKKWNRIVFSEYDETYRGQETPLLNSFFRCVHTLGNFIPIPFVRGRAKNGPEEKHFNGPRGRGSSKDYWDLALVCLYNYYAEKAGYPHITNNGQKIYTLEWLLQAEENVGLCKDWLDSFDSWNHFVERHFLQEFVNQEGGGYGQPKELWFGHFDGKSLPEKREEFDTFFRNASSQIIARGLRIAMAAKDYLHDKNLEQLAKQMTWEDA